MFRDAIFAAWIVPGGWPNLANTTSEAWPKLVDLRLAPFATGRSAGWSRPSGCVLSQAPAGTWDWAADELSLGAAASS